MKTRTETRPDRFRRKAANCDALSLHYAARGGELWAATAEQFKASAARLRREADEIERAETRH